MQVNLIHLPESATPEIILHLPRQILDLDWAGEEIMPPAEFSFAIDSQSLWFLCHRMAPAIVHPDSRPGKFQPELWKYDVAEFFILDPATGIYREFNLSPNGSWWSMAFTAPRVSVESDRLLAGVETLAEFTAKSWTAIARIPLASFGEFGGGLPEGAKISATFILNSPTQAFLTTSHIPDGVAPDFHRPQDFSDLRHIS